MTEQDLHYLKSILSNLREFRTLLPLAALPTIGTEVLNDNIDWLDCFVEKYARKPHVIITREEYDRINN